MALQNATAHATAAPNVLSDSSGATCTLVCPTGSTLYLVKLIVINGPALALTQGDVTLTGLAMGTLILPIIQVAQDTRTFELDFSAINAVGAPASSHDVNIAVTVPILLGGGETTVVLIGENF